VLGLGSAIQVVPDESTDVCSGGGSLEDPLRKGYCVAIAKDLAVVLKDAEPGTLG